MHDSEGLNFGTKLLVGSSTWPVDKSIPDGMLQPAVNVFAFNALIQNPDRRYDNPNLLTKGDALYAFDHEMAFSFLLDILPSASPWKLDGQTYLEKHVFYGKLKHKLIDLASFTELLGRLTESRVESLVGDVPAEWDNGRLLEIASHLATMREHAAQFAEEIRRRLV